MPIFSSKVYAVQLLKTDGGILGTSLGVWLFVPAHLAYLPLSSSAFQLALSLLSDNPLLGCTFDFDDFFALFVPNGVGFCTGFSPWHRGFHGCV